jgi:hypothetical protein
MARPKGSDDQVTGSVGRTSLRKLLMRRRSRLLRRGWETQTLSYDQRRYIYSVSPGRYADSDFVRAVNHCIRNDTGNVNSGYKAGKKVQIQASLFIHRANGGPASSWSFPNCGCHPKRQGMQDSRIDYAEDRGIDANGCARVITATPL